MTNKVIASKAQDVVVATVRRVVAQTRLGNAGPSDQPAKSARRLRVLLAEDAPINQLVIATMLRKDGHFVEIAVNGVQAVEAVGSGDFDLVLMDLQMPEMDGWQAAKAIRRLPGDAGRKIVILALTASAAEGVKMRCYDAGMNGCLSKPLRKEELLAALAHTVG